MSVETRQVTVGEWLAAGMTLPAAWLPQFERQPVVGITATECDEYAEKIGTRLPTWDESDQTTIAPVGWWCADVEGHRRVVRGGSWDFYQGAARAAYRVDYHPDYRYYFLGCRVVCVSPIDPLNSKSSGL